MKSIAMRTAKSKKNHKIERDTRYSWVPKNEQRSLKDLEVDGRVNGVERVMVYSVVGVVPVKQEQWVSFDVYVVNR
jgi:hypothetical protein